MNQTSMIENKITHTKDALPDSSNSSPKSTIQTPSPSASPSLPPLTLKPSPSTTHKVSNTQIIALSGALAGFLAGVSVCPLDVAKTRLQAQGVNSTKYSGIVGTLSTIVKDEGVRGLYRGVVPIVLGYFPTWMIYFTVYEKAKTVYPDLNRYLFGLESDFINHSMSAFAAGSVSTTITNPIWVVKTRLMLQTGNGKTTINSAKNSNKFIYNSTIDAFSKMYKYEGLRVFYSGLVPSLFGLFHVAIHFPVYEKLKIFFKCNEHTQDKQSRLVRLILASALSKMCASTLTYPHEILRTRMQIRSMSTPNSPISTSSNHDLLRMITNIYKKEGFLGYYSGFTTNLARTVPASAVTLVSFEYLSRYLRQVLA